MSLFSKKCLSGAMSAMLFFGPLLANDSSDSHQSGQESSSISESDLKRLSEAFGHFIGRNLNPPGVKFDLESMIKGMREGAEGKPAPMDEQEYEKLMTQLQEKAVKQIASDNLKAANDYLAKNAGEKGVVVVEPGKLQYVILKEGTGPTVTKDSTPLVVYTGAYADGTVFSSSEELGGPIPIPLSQTIPGFSKGIVGMKEGEKRRLFVHPDLAYQDSGPLPPNSLLVFDIEVVKAEAPKGQDGDDEEESSRKEVTESDESYTDDDDHSDDEGKKS